MIKQDYSDKQWLQPEPTTTPVKPIHGLLIACVAGLLLLGIPLPLIPIDVEL